MSTDMGAQTSIEWTEASWNPIRSATISGRVGWHCEIVSPGCARCYAQTINWRSGTGDPYLKRLRNAGNSVFLDKKILEQPLHWRKPRKIFVCSLSDLFGEWVPDEMLGEIFSIMARTPQHTYQVLTKRHERMRDYVSNPQNGIAPPRGSSPIPNIWLGVSVEDQRRADERIPVLLGTPAAVRWVSAEPLLELVTPSLSWGGKRLDWIVIGGEIGPGARPFNIEWARAIIRQCREDEIACFVKQLGRYPNEGTLRGCGVEIGIPLRDRKGGDMTEWPEDLRVREYPR